MPRLTPWTWWVGDDGETYSITECGTREEAILAGLREASPGKQIHILEARMWDRKTDPPDPDFMPFARTRNHEIIAVGPRKEPS